MIPEVVMERDFLRMNLLTQFNKQEKKPIH